MNEKKNSIKKRTCSCFCDITKFENFVFGNILQDEKSHKNILIYDVSYKPLIDPKPSRISLDKANGFIKDYDGTKYLVIFGL